MEKYDENNIFAKILRGELPCHKVCEDDDTLVIMDIMPRAEGHCLVIPKTPCRSIFDVDDETLAKIYSMAKKVSHAALDAFSADGITIHQYNEPAGGQVVFHLHMHVIPRVSGVKLRPHTGDMEKPEVLAKYAEKLKKSLQNLDSQN